MLFAIFCTHAITVLSLRSLRFTTPGIRIIDINRPPPTTSMIGTHGCAIIVFLLTSLINLDVFACVSLVSVSLLQLSKEQHMTIEFPVGVL